MCIGGITSLRYHVLFVIDIATRCVCIGGITSDPNGEWMKQVARNLTDMWDGFLLGKRYLIHDRDPLFTEAVRGLLRDSGVKPLRLPANSPNLNAYAERFVLSIRRECLDRFVPLSERHLRTAVTEYVVHYHTERNHQGLGNELLTPLPASANDAGPIVSRERLGGILNYYCRAAYVRVEGDDVEVEMVAGDGSPSAGSTGVAWKQLQEHASIFALD